MVKTIWMTKKELAWLTRYGQGYGPQFHEDLNLLESLLDQGRQEIVGVFSRGEACLITNMLNRCVYKHQRSAKILLLDKIDDTLHNKTKIETEWGVDPDLLMGKIQGLSEFGALAVIHSARHFWRLRSQETAPTGDLIRRTWPRTT